MTCNLAQIGGSCSSLLSLASNGRLDLLGTPADISLSHVARGFDRRNELEGDVSDTDDTNSTASQVANKATSEKKASEKDIDYQIVRIVPQNRN